MQMKGDLKCISISESEQSDIHNSLVEPMSPCHHLWPLVRVTGSEAMATDTLMGGACDLCLTNGSFIAPAATSTSPVFIALYFKLNPQQCPSITVARDLYWR